MSKSYYFLSLTLLFFISNSLYAQHRVSGTLVAENQETVAFATVMLLNAQDSVSVYKGTVSNEKGKFQFEEIAANSYLLKTSFVGFEPLLQKIEVKGNRDLGSLQMREASNNLDEVTINARKPKITRSIDRITFDVENSTLSTGNSWQILQQAPGVIMSQGELSVRNSSVTVYINDRKVQLTSNELQNLLESYSAENIKSVEVIHNPPARYEAEGGAIININTSKSLTPGYKGSLEGNFTQGIVPKYQLGTSHYWKGEKLNLFANYTFNPRKEIKRDDSYINFIAPSNMGNPRWDTDFQRITRSQAHNANLILDYDFDEKNRLSFSTNLMHSPNQTFDNSQRTDVTTMGNEPYSWFESISDVNTDETNLAMDLTYTHNFENGGELSLNSHYTNFRQERDQGVSTDYFQGNGELFQQIEFGTDALQKIDIITSQADYSTLFGETNFETGVRYSHIYSLSAINFLNAEDIEDLYERLSDAFRYREHIYAGYVSLSHDWEKWSVQAGLRGEYTDLFGKTVFTTDTNSQKYFELFPTGYLEYRLNDNHSFSVDYSRRIDRPRYQSLNPFRYFLNENDFNAGNPNLRAAISNNYNFTYSLLGQYFIDVFYKDFGESPASIAFQNNQRRFLRRVQMNLLENKSYGISLTHGRSLTPWWYGQVYASWFHDENRFEALESEAYSATNEIDAVFAQIYNAFTLSKDGTFSGNLTFLYVSDYMSGSYTFDPFSTLSIGLRKSLWDNRAVLSLNVNDIFNNTNTRLTSQYLNQDNSFFAREETRYIQIGFKYNFGNFRLKDNQRSINAAERDRL